MTGLSFGNKNYQAKGQEVQPEIRFMWPITQTTPHRYCVGSVHATQTKTPARRY